MKKILKLIRGIYFKLVLGNESRLRNWKLFSNKEYANNLIYQQLLQDKPCMIGRIGSTEMLCLTNYVGVKTANKSWVQYIKGETFEWWWEDSMLKQMQNWSGFFPATITNADKFSKLMIQDMKQVDVLGSWLLDEKVFVKSLQHTKQVVLEDLEPFFSTRPWTKALEGKKVLVVHPFAETIEAQYKKRDLLFENNLLPEFELKTIKAVQSLGGESTEYGSWFEALEGMKKQIEDTDFDICILGCGAYGFPLAAHIKRMGKKAVHLGGVTQLLFGIKGSRWEEYVVWPYMNLFNEHWVRPGEAEKPKNANQVEGACYW